MVRIGPSFEVKKERRARGASKGEAEFKQVGCPAETAIPGH